MRTTAKWCLRDKPADMIEAFAQGHRSGACDCPSGEVIDESLDIMRWALAQNDPEGWLERDDAGADRGQ